jgi:LPXTG-motif cell wall-anchored protein
MTVYTSKEEEGIANLSKAVLEPSVQTAITGDLVFVDYVYNEYNHKLFGDGLDYQVVALSAGDTYVTGKAGHISKPDYYLSKDQRVYWAALIGGLVILSLLIYLILRRRHKNRS